MTLVFGLIGIGVFSVFWLQEEAIVYSAATQENLSAEQRLITIQEYLRTYDPSAAPEVFLSLFRDISSRHAHIAYLYQALSAEISRTLFAELEALKTAVKGLSVEDVRSVYPDLDSVGQRARMFTLTRVLEELETLRSRLRAQEQQVLDLSRLSAQVQESLANDTQDIPWLEDALRRLESFNPHHALFQPPSVFETLIATIPDRVRQIKAVKAEQHKQQLHDQVRGFLAAKVTNVAALPNSF